MAYGTMEKIASVTVGAAGQTSIDFTNIPGTYKDLALFLSLKSERNTQYDYPELRFNDSTTSYSDRYIYGNGSSISSGTNTLIDWVIMASASGTTTTSTFSNDFIYILNYTSSNNKTVLLDTVAEVNATTNYMQLHAGLWSQSAAITKITIRNQFSLNWQQHSTATLYGITNVPSDSKASGGMITEDSSYWYHTFTSSGIFTPKQTINADILVIGGGAAGGWDGGGGGGAGGVIYFANQSLSTSGNTITVGAGGAGGGTTFGNAGSNSSFSLLTVGLGGGGGGSGSVNNAKTGGSGGGGGQDGSQPGAASVQANAGATAFYGNSGGQGKTTSGGSGGGGGGAGAAGTSNSNQAGGGNGTNAFSSWGSATSSGQNINGTYYFAGGGGGGTGWGVAGGAGGYGGGGAGGGPNTTQPIAGIANTGGGGGGGNGNPATSASGGSGIVIVRYAK